MELPTSDVGLAVELRGCARAAIIEQVLDTLVFTLQQVPAPIHQIRKWETDLHKAEAAFLEAKGKPAPRSLARRRALTFIQRYDALIKAVRSACNGCGSEPAAAGTAASGTAAAGPAPSAGAAAGAAVVPSSAAAVQTGPVAPSAALAVASALILLGPNVHNPKLVLWIGFDHGQSQPMLDQPSGAPTAQQAQAHQPHDQHAQSTCCCGAAHDAGSGTGAPTPVTIGLWRQAAGPRSAAAADSRAAATGTSGNTGCCSRCCSAHGPPIKMPLVPGLRPTPAGSSSSFIRAGSAVGPATAPAGSMAMGTVAMGSVASSFAGGGHRSQVSDEAAATDAEGEDKASEVDDDMEVDGDDEEAAGPSGDAGPDTVRPGHSVGGGSGGTDAAHGHAGGAADRDDCCGHACLHSFSCPREVYGHPLPQATLTAIARKVARVLVADSVKLCGTNGLGPNKVHVLLQGAPLPAGPPAPLPAAPLGQPQGAPLPSGAVQTAAVPAVPVGQGGAAVVGGSVGADGGGISGPAAGQDDEPTAGPLAGWAVRPTLALKPPRKAKVAKTVGVAGSVAIGGTASTAASPYLFGATSYRMAALRVAREGGGTPAAVPASTAVPAPAEISAATPAPAGVGPAASRVSAAGPDVSNAAACGPATADPQSFTLPSIELSWYHWSSAPMGFRGTLPRPPKAPAPISVAAAPTAVSDD